MNLSMKRMEMLAFWAVAVWHRTYGDENKGPCRLELGNRQMKKPHSVSKRAKLEKLIKYEKLCI